MNVLFILKNLPRPLLLLGCLSLILGLGLQRFSQFQEDEDRIQLTTFTKVHAALYQPVIDHWNADPGSSPVDISLVVYPALKQLMMNSTFSGRGFTDMVEIESKIANQIFAAPVDDILLKDLRPVLENEGLLEMINPPSLAPWIREGRIFGIPEDMHPVLLAYRADLVEEAGLSLDGVETWDEFFERLRPMVEDLDGDGIIDRYLINFWPTQRVDFTGVYLLQRNPGLVGEDGKIYLDTPLMAESLSDLLLWCLGPDRVAAEVPHFTAATYQLIREGYVVAMPLPDWYSQLLTNNLPDLAGKFKVIPLPAWEPGGTRTSVWGGTMMSFFHDSENFDQSWELAKQLLLNREAAVERYRRTGIIAPIASFWDDPAFSEPNPFFSNQKVGQLFIEQAPHVPTRYSSPYIEQALQQIQRILINTREKAEARKLYHREALIPLISEQLEEAQTQIDSLMKRNPYFP